MYEAILAFLLNSPSTTAAIVIKLLEGVKALVFGVLLTTAEVGECLLKAEFDRAGSAAITNFAEGTEDIINDALEQADLAVSFETGAILEKAAADFFEDRGWNRPGACETPSS